ncbi:MAG TPA: triple tyrosine motif-containing protein [Usitatibacter sp.]|nr:triple tyrosine motif-containing protein [Usitatibacter sp.]
MGRGLHRVARSVWLAAAAFATAFAGAEPAGEPARLVHESWTFKDGAPEVTAALAQTEDGYLWVGAPAGLFRFDGIRFELFRPASGEDVLSTNVSALQAADGGLWVGYVFGGFSFIRNGRVKNFDEVTGTVYGFARDRSGVVWAAVRGKRGDAGLWRFEGSTWQRLDAQWDIPLKAVAQVGVDRDGVVWVLSGGRGPEIPKDLLFLMPGERRFRKAAAGLLTSGFVTDADHQVLTAAQARDARAGGPPIAWEPGVPAYPILPVQGEGFVDRTQRAWLSANDALVARSAPSPNLAQTLATMSPKNADAYDAKAMLEARLVDREGSIWIGGETALHRFSYGPIVPQPLPPAAPSPWLMVAPDDGGAVWINASDGAGRSALYHVAGGRVAALALPGGASSFTYRAADKSVWLGGEDGIWRVQGGVPRRIALPPETADFLRFLTAATEDSAGAMWFSFAGGGLFRLEHATWTKYRPAGRGCPASGVVILFADRRGRVWLGCTRNQAAVIEDGHERQFGAGDGLAVGNVTAIHGRGDNIWIGGELGVQRFDNGRFRTLRALDGEALRGISGIVETANGDLWLNGLGGIVHIRASEIAAAAIDPDHRVSAERFDRRAGLPGLASQLGKMPTAIEGTDGRLWFSVNNGVVSVDPSQVPAKPIAPPVSIQSVVADEKGYDPGAPLVLPAGTSSLQLRYDAVSLLHPEAIRFRYRLSDVDAQWHEVGRATAVSYRSLAPGPYRFEVAASDADGKWSGETASLAFTILPVFYQTTWFRTACALVLAIFAWTIYRVRIGQLRRQLEMKLGARLSERMRIARELHDTLLQRFHGLLQQMQAALVLLRRDPAQAEKVLGEAIDQAAQAVTEGRDAVQGLRARAIDDLPEALRSFVDDLSAGAAQQAVQVRIDVEGTPRALHPVVNEEVFHIGAEALRNAFNHAQAKRIALLLQYGRRDFRLSVRDDGKGIDEAHLEGREREGHFGLRGMHERAEVVGAVLAVSTRRGSGTQIELRIPASRAYASSPVKAAAAAVH